MHAVDVKILKFIAHGWNSSKLATTRHVVAGRFNLLLEVINSCKIQSRNSLRRKKAGLNFRSGIRLLSSAHSTWVKRDYMDDNDEDEARIIYTDSIEP